jgi:outer membrane immunogenic protein
MKKLLLGTAISLATVGVAAAADLPPAPAPIPVYSKAPPPVWSWTGCYVGGNIGGGWSHNDTASSATFAPPNVEIVNATGSGVVGGGQVGCDYQFAGGWVIGVAGEFEASGIKGTTVIPANAALGILANTAQVDINIPWIATATARLGYAVTPATLLYVRGGGAWMRDNADIALIGPPVTVAAVATDNRSGWTVGGGIEQKFWSNMSAFVEYNYLDFGKKDPVTFVGVPPTPGALPTSIKSNISEVLVGLNFRFGGP